MLVLQIAVGQTVDLNSPKARIHVTLADIDYQVMKAAIQVTNAEMAELVLLGVGERFTFVYENERITLVLERIRSSSNPRCVIAFDASHLWRVERNQ